MKSSNEGILMKPATAILLSICIAIIVLISGCTGQGASNNTADGSAGTGNSSNYQIIAQNQSANGSASSGGAANTSAGGQNTQTKTYHDIGFRFDYPSTMTYQQASDKYDNGKGFAAVMFSDGRNDTIEILYVNYSSVINQTYLESNSMADSCDSMLPATLLGVDDHNGDPLFQNMLNSTLEKTNISGFVLQSSLPENASAINGSGRIRMGGEIGFNLTKDISGYALSMFNCDSFFAVSVRMFGPDRAFMDSAKETFIKSFEFD